MDEHDIDVIVASIKEAIGPSRVSLWLSGFWAGIGTAVLAWGVARAVGLVWG